MKRIIPTYTPGNGIAEFDIQAADKKVEEIKTAEITEHPDPSFIPWNKIVKAK